MADTEHIVCPVCARDFALSAVSGTAYPSQQTGAKDLLKSIHFCPGCGTGIAFPSLTDGQLDQLYEGGDYWQDKDLKVFSPKSHPGAYVNALARWEFVKTSLRLPQGSALSVLDIGGGHGFFGAAIARDRSVRLEKYTIVEKDKFFQQSLALTWRQLYPQVDFAVHSDISQAAGQYCLVVLSHVLEHVNDPQGMLKIASGKLEAGGHVLTDVPYQDFLFKKDVFPHILFFKPENIALLYQRAGFEPVAVGCFGISQKSAKDRWVSSGPTLFLERLLYHCKGILPLPLSQRFYELLFKPGTPDPNGIWIRALARK